MTRKEKNALLREIKYLLKRSYEDDGNTYELEFRSELEEIVDRWGELTVSNPREKKEKHKLTVLFGESLSDYAADYGCRKAKKKLRNGDIEGDIETYSLDTMNDVQELVRALGDFDGWMGYYLDDKS